MKFDYRIRGEVRITYEYTGMGIQNRFISGLLHFDCDIITESTMATGAGGSSSCKWCEYKLDFEFEQRVCDFQMLCK